LLILLNNLVFLDGSHNMKLFICKNIFIINYTYFFFYIKKIFFFILVQIKFLLIAKVIENINIVLYLGIFLLRLCLI